MIFLAGVFTICLPLLLRRYFPFKIRMAPKVWTRPPATTATSKPADVKSAVKGVRGLVSGMILENNLLGLPESEIQAMTEIILTCATRKEVYDWCTGTLMLSESSAAEIIRQREDLGLLFTGDPNPGKQGNSSATSVPVRSPTTSPGAATPTSTTKPASGSQPAAAAKPSASGASPASATPPAAPAKPQLDATTVWNGAIRSRGPMEDFETASNSAESVATTATTAGTSKSGKGKPGKGGYGKKGVPLSSVGPNALVKGEEFECGCFASQHGFKSNCLNCGRIICEQEGTEMCYSCGLDPGRCLSYEIKVENGKIDDAAAKKNAAAYKDALERRDKLLQFARERAKRTQIIDDQAGHYSSSVWMSAEERKAAEAKDAEMKKKVAALHRATGAYTVHLDIVKQSVQLGATPILKQAAEGESAGGVGKKLGYAEDNDDLDREDNDDETNPLEHGSGGEGDSSSEVEEQFDVETDTRILPLPSVLQKIWYVSGDEPAQVLAERAKEDQIQISVGKNQPKELRELALKQRDRANLKKSQFSTAGESAISCRLQNDYYEEDVVEWNVARQLDHFEHQHNRAASSSPPVLQFRSDPPPPSAEEEAMEARRAAGAELAKEMEEVLQGSGPSSSGISKYKITQQMRSKDEGMCLSMHQPWASLLVAGIKTHEGRSWPTKYRGRLWIHAAAAKPQDVESVEAHCRQFVPDGTKFPTNYPTSCLLGYTYVVDCLSKEDYQKQFPVTEQQSAGSEFVFICLGSKLLPFMLGMEGDHKIFKLDRKFWQAARAQLGER